MAENANGERRDGGASGRCPICGGPASARYRPFCSKRCADVDLSRWLGGVYRIPAEPDENERADAASKRDSKDEIEE